MTNSPVESIAKENPLLRDGAAAWDRLIEAAGPASLIVVIGERMGAVLRGRFEPEDVWQEVLLLAWRDRTGFEWRGQASFRSWLLTIADHRIRDLVQHENAEKRGGGATLAPSPSGTSPSGFDSSSASSVFAGPIATTTPSRAASLREEARVMRAALEELSDEVRDIVRLRLFEERPIEEIAATLGIGESAVRHRFRKGLEAYAQRLKTSLHARGSAENGKA